MKLTKTKIFKIVFIANAILSATIIINEPVKIIHYFVALEFSILLSAIIGYIWLYFALKNI